MNAKKLLIGGLAAAAGCYLAGAAYTVSQLDIEEALVCADEGSLLIPAAQQICRSYVLALRGTPEDIAELHAGIGAGFVVQGSASAADKAEMLAFLQARGLDINRPDVRGMLPLHASILAGRPDEVALLLKQGANPSLKNAQQQDALAYARALHQAKGRAEHREIAELLARTIQEGKQ
ncbi:ankyrin repeat domain-containing protein [Chitinilyticum litopenaei]|uniref:ankyrin repeat domain-containing protein n=1 Tax=Chitinilyticum litopenaei TaxID=1121276 RepID=UPI000411512D|nr:ankyrin repeat domain-containing protein [Chitinilyticum litopenaei]